MVFQGTLGSWLLPAGFDLRAYAAGVIGCALFPAAFAAAAALLHRRAPVWTGVSLPALWVLSEYARSHFGFASAPWGLLGYTQLETAPVARIAGVAGALGVSLALAAVNGAFAWVADRRALRAGALGVAAALAAAAALAVAALLALPRGPAAERLRVAVVQAGSSDGVAPDSDAAARLFEGYRTLTRRAAAQGATLVVWPESSVPASLPDDREALSNLARLARELRVHLLVSALGRDKSAPGMAGRRANSALMFGPDGRPAGRYDKVRLLPFVEYLPGRGLLPWPGWVGGASDAVPGDAHTVFEAGGARFAVQLCWENLFAGELRNANETGLDFVVSMTNEAFTSAASGRRQLFQANAMRALESGLPLLRAATTGVSAVVAPDGAELARVRDAEGRDLDAIGFAVVDVPLRTPASLYARHGDWLVALASLAVAAAALASLRRTGGPG